MNLNQKYEIVSNKMDLIDYIYYLQYELNYDDIRVETNEAVFMVWEGSTFKVNGEESSTSEFYEMLASVSNQVTCNSESFEYIGDKFVSSNEIKVKRVKNDNMIKF